MKRKNFSSIEKSAQSAGSQMRQKEISPDNALAQTPPDYGIELLDRGLVGNRGTAQRRDSGYGEANESKGSFGFTTTLPDNLRSGLELLSGIAMDDVRVHRNSSKPAQLQAQAYAQGTDIHLAPSQERHLPHEAWHVVQQKQGRVKSTIQARGVGINDDQGLEKEADTLGAQAARGPATSSGRDEIRAPFLSSRTVPPGEAVVQGKFVDIRTGKDVTPNVREKRKKSGGMTTKSYQARQGTKTIKTKDGKEKTIKVGDQKPFTQTSTVMKYINMMEKSEEDFPIDMENLDASFRELVDDIDGIIQGGKEKEFAQDIKQPPAPIEQAKPLHVKEKQAEGKKKHEKPVDPDELLKETEELRLGAHQKWREAKNFSEIKKETEDKPESKELVDAVEKAFKTNYNATNLGLEALLHIASAIVILVAGKALGITMIGIPAGFAFILAAIMQFVIATSKLVRAGIAHRSITTSESYPRVSGFLVGLEAACWGAFNILTLAMNPLKWLGIIGAVLKLIRGAVTMAIKPKTDKGKQRLADLQKLFKFVENGLSFSQTLASTILTAIAKKTIGTAVKIVLKVLGLGRNVLKDVRTVKGKKIVNEAKKVKT